MKTIYVYENWLSDSKAQYDKSLGELIEKMGIEDK